MSRSCAGFAILGTARAGNESVVEYYRAGKGGQVCLKGRATKALQIARPGHHVKERATKVSLIARAGSHALQRAGNESVVNYRGGQGRASQLNCTIKVRAVQHALAHYAKSGGNRGRRVADAWQTL